MCGETVRIYTTATPVALTLGARGPRKSKLVITGYPVALFRLSQACQVYESPSVGAVIARGFREGA